MYVLYVSDSFPTYMQKDQIAPVNLRTFDLF